MQRLYLRILKGSPRLQTLKLIGIECKEPVEIACIESIEVVESEVEFLLSEPVVTKKEDKIICLRWMIIYLNANANGMKIAVLISYFHS